MLRVCFPPRWCIVRKETAAESVSPGKHIKRWPRVPWRETINSKLDTPRLAKGKAGYGIFYRRKHAYNFYDRVEREQTLSNATYQGILHILQNFPYDKNLIFCIDRKAVIDVMENFPTKFVMSWGTGELGPYKNIGDCFFSTGGRQADRANWLEQFRNQVKRAEQVACITQCMHTLSHKRENYWWIFCSQSDSIWRLGCILLESIHPEEGRVTGITQGLSPHSHPPQGRSRSPGNF